MKQLIFALIITLISIEKGQTQTIIGHEIGVEGYLGASTQGGNLGFGLKYGLKLNENIIVGPSFRLMRGWSKNYTSPTSTNYSYSIYGAGIFAHARYGNMVFGGIEIEMIKTPFNFSTYTLNKSWVPTCFIGGGFSREFKEIVRVNVGVFYDVINNVNSPFRTSYKMTKTNSLTGQVSGYIPVIYRINFFFRIGKGKEKKVEEEEEEEKL